MRKILTQFICTIVICCQVLNLMPIVMFAKADLSATYSLKPEEIYEYKFTPEISGLYILTVTNLSDYSNNRISLTSDDGNVLTEYWQCYDRDLPAPMYFVLQAGTEYTYVHKENFEIFGKHILKIELDDTPVLTLNNTASVSPYATEEEYVVDFVKFTSSDSGWYTFEIDNLESNEAYLMKLYTYTGVLLDDAYYYLSTNGLNIFLDAKTDYYLQFEDLLYSSSKRQQIVRVSKSEFPNLIENQPLPISFWGMEDGEAESISYKYARFIPAKSGLYTFDAKLTEVYDWDTYNWLSEEQKEKQFDWYGTRFLLFDSKGDEIEPENIWVDGQYVWGLSYNQKEYALVAGEEYYLGASTFLSGLYTFNVNHVGTVKLTAPELNLLTSGDLYGESGFNISWSSVAGAESYTVKVLNSAGNVAFIDSVPYSDSEYTISHLPAGTYSVSVNGVSASGEEGPLSNVLTVSLLDGVAPCKEHKYTSAGGDICTVCGFVYEYELVPYDKTMYAAINNVPVRNTPYEKSGRVVDRLDKGEKVGITHSLVNSVGNKWYLTEDGNYIYSERLTTKGPKTYTMKFVANGSGVKNLPEAIEVQENVRYKIPGKMSGAPERSGYTFLGYSTNKKATTAEYVIGQSVEMTKDITLYVVWAEKANNYREDIENLTASIIAGKSTDSKIGDSGAKYWSWYYGKTSSRKDSWCAVYVSYLLSRVGVEWDSSFKWVKTSPIYQRDCLEEYDCYYDENSGYKPKTGDIVFWDWNNGGAPEDHVGMVIVDENGVANYLHGNYHSSLVKDGSIDNTVVCYSDSTYCAVDKNEHNNYLNARIIGYGDMETYIDVYLNNNEN